MAIRNKCYNTCFYPFTIDLVFENCFLSAMAPYVFSRDGRSLSIYGSECQIWKTLLWISHRCLCRVKNMLAMYLKYHNAGLTPTTPVTSIAISPVKMSIGRKSLTNLRSEMIFLQGKPVFYIFLTSTPPYWQITLRFCWQWTPKWQQSDSRSRATYFRLSVVLGEIFLQLRIIPQKTALS